MRKLIDPRFVGPARLVFSLAFVAAASTSAFAQSTQYYVAVPNVGALYSLSTTNPYAYVQNVGSYFYPGATCPGTPDTNIYVSSSSGGCWVKDTIAIYEFPALPTLQTLEGGNWSAFKYTVNGITGFTVQGYWAPGDGGGGTYIAVSSCSPNGTAAMIYAMVREALGGDIIHPGNLHSTGLAPFETVNVIGCQDGTCAALPDPNGHGLGAATP